MAITMVGRRAWKLPLLVALTIGGMAHAQESVNGALDGCINNERVKSTLKGALAGGLLGLAKAKLVDDKHDSNVGKSVAVGAALGGAAGFVTAHFQAVGKCYRKNPTWVPESKVERSADYETLRAQWQYKPEAGVVAKTMQVSLPGSVKPGGKLELMSNFGVMTPDGAEADVVIERRLFAVLDGKETELPFTGKAREQRKLEAGASVDRAELPIPADIPVGTAFRYEFSIAAAGQAASSASASTRVN